MIDPSMFDTERLVAYLLGYAESCLGGDQWRQLAEIVPDYLPPFSRPGDRPKCVVRYGEGCFLRHSQGPRQGHFWDVYGDDYLNPELALIALTEAPAPWRILRPNLREEHDLAVVRRVTDS